MTTLSAHTTRAIHNKGMQAVYGIAAEYNVDAADVIALLGTTSHTSITGHHSPFVRLPDTTPSQPEPTSLAPAADPSIAPTVDVKAEEASPVTSAAPSFQTTERAPDHGPAMAPKETASDKGESNSRPSARGHSLPDNRDGALAADLGTTQREDGASPALPSEISPTPPRGRPETTRAKVVACHVANPSWPSKLIAEHLDISEDSVRATASRKNLTLVSWWEYQRVQAAKTAAALRVAVKAETPPPAIPEPSIAPTEPPPPSKPEPLAKRIAAYLADHPDATLKEVTEALGAKMQAVGWAAQKAGIVLRKRTAGERSEASAKGAQGRVKASPPATLMLPDETAIQPDETVQAMGQALVRARPPTSKSARFYIRDSKNRYLHQSLERSPTDNGPLMTDNRKWAWFDNAQRFSGACKKWPEIETMRKEGVQP